MTTTAAATTTTTTFDGDLFHYGPIADRLERLLSMVSLVADPTSAAAGSFEEESYQMKVLRVDDIANAILKYELPVVPGFGALYTEFTEKLRGVKLDMSSWTGSIRFQLARIPKDMLEQARDVDGSLAECMQIAKKLQGDPGNQVLKSQLKRNLDGISVVFQGNDRQVGSLREKFVTFQAARDTDIGVLKDISEKAVRQGSVNSQQIELLRNKIDGLNREIATRGVTIALGALVTGAGVVIGLIGLVLAPFTGGASLLLLIPAVAVAGGGATIIALSAVQIQRLRDEIEAHTKTMNELSLATALLLQISGAMKSFGDQLSVLGDVLGGVQGAWAEMAQLTAKASKSIQDASSTEDWKKVEQSIGGAVSDWGHITAAVKKLELVETKVAPEPLTIGSDEEANRRIVARAQPIGAN